MLFIRGSAHQLKLVAKGESAKGRLKVAFAFHGRGQIRKPCRLPPASLRWPFAGDVHHASGIPGFSHLPSGISLQQFLYRGSEKRISRR